MRRSAGSHFFSGRRKSWPYVRISGRPTAYANQYDRADPNSDPSLDADDPPEDQKFLSVLSKPRAAPRSRSGSGRPWIAVTRFGAVRRPQRQAW
jgi:hypothetical protein